MTSVIPSFLPILSVETQSSSHQEKAHFPFLHWDRLAGGPVLMNRMGQKQWDYV